MNLTCKSIQNRSYDIVIEWNAVDRIAQLTNAERASKFYVISDANVFALHRERLLKALKDSSTFHFIVPPGESSKSLNNWKRIQDFLMVNGADRRSTVIAFGGGVVGDLAGFSASTFMRGLRFIQIPTTVLSQSDSSIGAKVAVNHPAAKNLIGSFWQPALVVIDPSLLSTLPRRELSAGLGEAIKYGVIADPDLFERLYASVEDLLTYNKEFLTDLIQRCVQIKVRVVEEDERETGLRKILNFGHTIGHALEQATHYRRLRHGEAVAWGMLAGGWLSVQRRMWNETEFEKLKSIIMRSGALYPLGRLTAENILTALQHDKKKVGQNFAFVLAEKTGSVKIVTDVSQTEVLQAINYIFSLRAGLARSTRI
jgi:3-dehydroquinate synthase